MLRVALTGGIATGKSYVRARIEARGVPAIDADAVVHALLGAGTDVTAAVAARFGRSVLRADGAVDRAILGRIVFSDSAARGDLERLLHPRVYDRILGWMAEQAKRSVAWALADVPLLFETGREAEFDRVIVAVCPAEEQVRRVMRRDGLDERAARARLAAQWPIVEKARRASDLVDTGGSFKETDRQVEALCNRLDGLATSRA